MRATFCLLSLFCLWPSLIAAQGNPSSSTGILSAPTESQTVHQPTGTSFTIQTPGVFSGSFSQPFLLLQHGMTAAQIRTMQGANTTNPNAGSLADVLTCGQTIPAGATVGQANCFSAFQRAFSPTNPVGFYGRVEPAVDGITEWGANFNLSDKDDVTGSVRHGTTEFGLELNTNVTDRSTAGAALLFGSIFLVQPANMGAIHLPLPNLYSGNKWSYGFVVDDGAVGGPAISLGTSEPPLSIRSGDSARSAGSQTIIMNWRDISGLQHGSALRVDNRGVFHVVSDRGLTVDTGPVVTPSLSVSGGISSNSGIQHLRVALGCSTFAHVGSTCTSIPITWAVSFPDTHYTLSCSLESTQGVPVVTNVSKRAADFTITVAALTEAAATGTADCIAMHDAQSPP